VKLPRRAGGPPEDSRAIRVVVAIAVEVGVLAVVLQGAVESSAAAAALLLAPAGYAFSYVRRRRSGVVIKAILAIGLLLALDRFIGQVRFATTVDQARIPLASLFLWVQVLHAFDVPRRRDLAFSMVSSTTLIAAAGALALTTSFIWIVLAWAASAAAWLWLSSTPRPMEQPTRVSVRRVAPDRPRRAAVARSAGVTAVAAAVLATALFAATPRIPASLIRTPPFHLAPSGGTPADSTQPVTNPGAPPPDQDGVVDFQPDAYPGFGDSLDLRARGQLSDDVVFRVRAEWPALWRAQAFDTFDGSSWTESSARWRSLQASASGSYEIQSAAPGWGPTLTQTFYLDGQQPNVLFAAANAHRIYFPSGGLQTDKDGVIRSPILLDPGTVYSVESVVPAATADELRAMGPFEGSERVFGRYLQVPDDLPERDRALATQITTSAHTEYDAVDAVQTWLDTDTTYDLTVPRQPDGIDAVDWFLFDSRRGFCEHIASAMAILLRSAGIPTRVVTGYGPGERNPFTGYFEVRQSNAHAWVEVWYPRYGWIPYDPTFGVPATTQPWGSLVGQEIFQALGRALGAVPAPVRRAVAASVHAVAGAARGVANLWPLALLVVAGAAAGWILRRRRRPGRDLAPDEIGRAFEDLVETLAAAGVPRDPSRTPAELLTRASEDPAIGRELVRSAGVVVRTFERARYAPARGRPDPAEVARASAEAARARALRPRTPAVPSHDVPEHQAPA
jgi:protein-glutamine gamma-glutamyltransferase